MVETTASKTRSSKGSPSRFFSGMPTRSTSGSSASSPCSVIGDRDEGAAGESHAAALDHGAGRESSRDRAVLVDPAGGHLADDAGITRAELDQVAVANDQDARHAGGAREQEHARSGAAPRHGRDQELRLGPGDHVAQFVAAGMAGDVDQMVAVGEDLDALQHQIVDDGADGLLVARDGARGEDHAVAAVERDLGMIVIVAMRASAARGSPWLPVHSASTLSCGRWP